MTTEPTLRSLLHDFWAARRWLVVGGIAGVLAAFFFVMLAVPHYKGAMMVTPATRAGTSDVSALFPETTSFAVEQVMTSLGLGQSSHFNQFEALIREPSVAQRLLEDEKIVAGLRQTGRFHIGSAPAPLSPVSLSAWLDRQIRLSPVNGAGLRKISFEHPDPEFALYFLKQLYLIGDDLIREQMQDKTQSRIAWLKDTIATTAHPDHRRVLTRLLMDQEQINLVLEANEPFSALIAEPPSVTEKPYWPQKKIFYPFFIAIGLLLSFAAWAFFRSPSESAVPASAAA